MWNTIDHARRSFGLRANQSLNLTAKAEVVSRCAKENAIVVSSRRQCETEFRIVR
jgi:hypothetical protein